MRPVRREDDHVIAVPRETSQTRRLSQYALAPVPKDGVTEPLRCDEGDPSRAAFVERCHSNTQVGIVITPPLREDPLKIPA